MISIDRAKTILECYGGHPHAWPEKERQALQQALSGSRVLQKLQQEALTLDAFMGFSSTQETSVDQQSIDQCVKQIYKNLPVQTQDDKTITYKHPIRKTAKKIYQYNRPALRVASIMLALTGLIANMEYLHTDTTEHLLLSDYMAIYVDENNMPDSLLIDDSSELELLAFLEPDILEDDSLSPISSLKIP